MRGLEGYLDVEERESQRFHRRTVRRMLGRVAAEGRLILPGLLLVVLATAAGLLEPWIFGQAVDRAIQAGKIEWLAPFALALASVTTVRIASLIGQARLFEWIGQKVTHQLRMELFAHLQSLPISTYDKHPSGRLVTRIVNDVATIGDMFSMGFVSMALNILTLVGILGWLVILHPALGWLCVAVMVPLGLSTAYFSARLRNDYRNTRSKLSALNAFLAENLAGMRILQLFNRERIHFERFRRINEWYSEAQVGTLRTFALFQPTITLGQGLATMVVLGFGAMAVSRGEIPLGTLVAFFAYVQMLFQPMRELADRWIAFVSGMASAERVFSMLEWRDEEGRAGTLRLDRIPSVHGGQLKAIRGEIVFENVWFSYREENWVLKDFNLTVRAGERIGVVGHTGAGKSTLIQLLLRFHEPRRGRILLDGRDLREWDRRELRARIGMIQQEVFLFSGTVDENIRLWVGGGGDRVRPEDVADLGIDAEMLGGRLEERGGNRSQGERQLLAFARARAARPSLWILDEATANVDSETEIRLERAFTEASRGRTVFMIAHRLSTVRSCDRILVLHRGELVEQGSHSELVAAGGLYAHLHRAQLAAQAAVEADGLDGAPVGVQPGSSPA